MVSEGSVYKRSSDGRYCAKYRTADGKTRVLYGATKNEARRKLRAALEERDRGVTGSRTSLAAWCSWWLGRLDVRPTTAADYAYKLSLVPGWLGEMELARVTPMDVTCALDELLATPTVQGRPRSSSTVAQVRTVLGNCLRDAERYGHVTRNAARLAQPVKVQAASPEPLTATEVKALLAASEGHPLRTLWLVAITTGLRQSEAIGLTWDRVDLDAGVVTVSSQLTRTNTGQVQDGPTKTKRSARTVQLPPTVVSTLRQHRVATTERRLMSPWWEDNNLVWPTGRGTAYSHRNVLRKLQTVCDDAGIRRVSFHTLRHTAATLMLDAGVPDSTIQDVLGHSDGRMLGRYAHVTDSLRSSAADAMERVLGE